MRWTTNIRQAAERLAEAMPEVSLKRKTRTRWVVINFALTKEKRLESAPKTSVQALGYMAYLLIDIYGHDPEEVLATCKFRGRIPLDSGLAPHEESALRTALEEVA